MCQSYNQARNAIVQKIAKQWKDNWWSRKKDLPSMNTVLDIVLRKIDVGVPDNMEVFMFYWDCILPQVVGEGTDWNKSKRHYNIISEAMNDENKPFISASHEAFVATVFANYRECWLNMWKVKEDNDGKALKHVGGLPDGQEDDGSGFYTDHENIYLYGKQFKGKWSDNTSGADITGGWRKDGLKYFADLRDRVIRRRKLDKSLQIERRVYEALREKNELGEDATYGDTMLRKKKKARKSECDPEDLVHFRKWTDDNASAYDSDDNTNMNDDDPPSLNATNATAV